MYEARARKRLQRLELGTLSVATTQGVALALESRSAACRKCEAEKDMDATAQESVAMTRLEQINAAILQTQDKYIIQLLNKAWWAEWFRQIRAEQVNQERKAA